MTDSQASDLEGIKKFLEWLWWDEYVEFFRRIPEEIECSMCKGRGHTKQPYIPFGEEGDDEIGTLLKKVTPTQLGYACGQCQGRGYIMSEREQSGPDNVEYWINRYLGIEQKQLPIRLGKTTETF